MKFLEYLKKIYLKSYKNWNYYNNVKHITNNSSKYFNSYLSNFIFEKTFYSNYKRKSTGI